MTLKRLPPVDGELAEAKGYYDAISADLGTRLYDEFVRALRLIERFPQGWHPLGGELLQCRLKTFPYAVIYAVVHDDIVVLAFANTHRRPGYWRERIGSALQ